MAGTNGKIGITSTRLALKKNFGGILRKDVLRLEFKWHKLGRTFKESEKDMLKNGVRSQECVLVRRQRGFNVPLVYFVARLTELEYAPNIFGQYWFSARSEFSGGFCTDDDEWCKIEPPKNNEIMCLITTLKK